MAFLVWSEAGDYAAEMREKGRIGEILDFAGLHVVARQLWHFEDRRRRLHGQTRASDDGARFDCDHVFDAEIRRTAAGDMP